MFKIKDEFLTLYEHSFDDVDIWVGGIFETGDAPGELFRAIISDQFQRIRDGDRFWYQNKNNEYVIVHCTKISALYISMFIISSVNCL